MASAAVRVDSLSPLEARTAVKQYSKALQEEEERLTQLKQFLADNDSLAQLVVELPDRIDHKVMVPFGKKAFFPGRLIHTNEFHVLIGEGYYVERSARQTIDILQRRREYLKSKMRGVQLQINDLQMQHSFVEETVKADEFGVVDIREPYVETAERAEPSCSQSSDVLQAPQAASGHASEPRESAERMHNQAQSSKGAVVEESSERKKREEEDVEHRRLMARLDELERLEAKAAAEEGEDTESEGLGEEEEEEEEEAETYLQPGWWAGQAEPGSTRSREAWKEEADETDEGDDYDTEEEGEEEEQDEEGEDDGKEFEWKGRERMKDGSPSGAGNIAALSKRMEVVAVDGRGQDKCRVSETKMQAAVGSSEMGSCDSRGVVQLREVPAGSSEEVPRSVKHDYSHSRVAAKVSFKDESSVVSVTPAIAMNDSARFTVDTVTGPESLSANATPQRKAFTGKVLERESGLRQQPVEPQSTQASLSASAAKETEMPQRVSKFKMRARGR